MINRYKRVFITLNQDRKEFSLKNNKAIGSCIIESQYNKGKIMFNIQNLKSGFIYKAFLIGNIEGTYIGVNIGNIVVNEKGKANLRVECNANNIKNTGISLDNFEIAAILVDNKEDFLVPLVGYKYKQVSWKNNFKDYNKTNKKIEEVKKEHNIIKEIKENEKEIKEVIKENKKEIKELIKENEKEIKELIKENEKEIKEPIKENEKEIKENNYIENEYKEGKSVVSFNIDNSKKEENKNYEKIKDYKSNFLENKETIKGNINNIKEIYKNFESNIKKDTENNIEDKYESNIHETFKSMAKKFNKEIKELESFTLNKEFNLENNNLSKIEKELFYMFKNNAKMIPFYNNDENIIWIRISLKEMVHLSTNFWDLMNSSFIVLAFQKYKHLILGKCVDNNKYILGVPEIYCEKDEIFIKKLGFTNFKYCDDIKNKKTSHGYWLMNLNIY